MSGSIEDQRKVGRIGSQFVTAGSLPVRVHLAATHSEAEAHAHRIVAGGGRILVSAGGAGTFNAVLAMAMKGDAERCLAAGCDGYLAKPVDPDDVLQVIEEQLARGARPAASGHPARA